MSFIDMGTEFANAKEPEIAPDDTYDLRCEGVDEFDDPQNEKKHLRVRIVFEDHDEYQAIFHYLALPAPWDEKRDADKGNKPGTTSRTKMLMLKRFLHAFNIPLTDTGFDPMDIPGSTARLGVKQDAREMNDGTVRRSNVIVLPNLPNE